MVLERVDVEHREVPAAAIAGMRKSFMGSSERLRNASVSAKKNADHATELSFFGLSAERSIVAPRAAGITSARGRRSGANIPITSEESSRTTDT